MTPEAIAALLPDAPPDRVPGPPPRGRAAVAVVLRPRPAQWPEMLMIKRSEHEGDPWSGHMAFPGGRQDPEDPSLIATAVRETREELALDLAPAQRLGALAPVYSPRVAPLRVDAWTFWLDRVPPLDPNEEVASTHWFGLDRLLLYEGRATFPFTWKGQKIAMPCYRLDDLLDRLRTHPEAPSP